MKKMNTFYRIEGWMSDILKGSELTCFAVIYSYSCGNMGRYIGGLNFLAELMSCSQPTASAALKKLLGMGLIEKEEVITTEGRRMHYWAVDDMVNKIRLEQLEKGVQKNLMDGVQKNFMDGVQKNLMSINKDNNSTINSTLNSLNINNSHSCISACARENSLLEVEKSELLSDETWQEAVCMKTHMTREELRTQIEEFFVYCQCAGTEAHNSVSDAKGHFFNRLTQQLNSNKKAIKFRAYDVQPEDSEKEAKFKTWMRTNHAELENVEKPLSYEEWCALRAEYIEDFEGTVDCEAFMRQVLNQIDANIGYYRMSNIYATMRRKFEERR